MDGKVKQANGLNLTSFLNRYETPVTAAESINAGVDIEYRRRAHIVFWEQYLWFWFGGFWVLHRPSPSDDTRHFGHYSAYYWNISVHGNRAMDRYRAAPVLL